MAMSPRLLRPRASGFNPKSIAGLHAWWDATVASSYTVSTGVSSWRDRASNIDATQATGSAQPLVSSINGRTAFEWKVGDKLLGLSSYSITAQSTFCVMQAESTGAYNRIVCQESETENANYIALLMPNTATYQVGSYFDGGYRSAVTVTQSSATIAESHHNGTSLTCVANGVSGSPYLASLSFSPTKIAIGNAAAAATNTFVGRIGEILIWNRAMTATEITTVRRYLARKWGITI
jgi:hypothetical protein